MLFKSQIVTAASGSIGGATFSRNRSGMYIRGRSIPVNPASSFQQVVRNALAQLVTRWTETLTQAQRDLWETYAANVPVLNPLGDAINLSGQNMYVRSNASRIQSGVADLPIVDAAPGTFDLGTFSPPSFTASAADQELHVNFTEADDWVGEEGSALLVYSSRPQQASIGFFKGPYRFGGEVLGAVAPPTTPGDITTPFAFVLGQRVFAQFRVTRADGRLSTPSQATALVTT
jgi:hypothetical protein